MTTHVLKVALADVRPAVWRWLAVPSDASLVTLHAALQLAFGWGGTHLHEFRAGARRYGVPAPDDTKLLDEADVTLSDVLPRKTSRLKYVYNLGESWLHLIAVEGIEETAPAPASRLRPRRRASTVACIAGERAAPPEDCGGPEGYADFLRALEHPNHVRHAEMWEWSCGTFDPERVDLKDINRRLAAL